MKKIFAALSALLIIFTLNLTVFADSGFSDIPQGAWYEKDVEYVKEISIFNGTSENEFSPDAPFTRAMFVVSLGRLAKIDASDYNWKVLGDVSPDDWYGPYVAWAFDRAITQSMGNDDFRPDYNVTREQIATFIARFLKNCTGVEIKTTETDYGDADKISAFAVESIDICAGLGLMQGDENGNFRPQDGITRAEAAAVMARLHRLVDN